MPEKVVLAYSGGLDTSIIIPWLKENYSYDVIAMVGDVGQGDDIEAVVEKAYATGARASRLNCACTPKSPSAPGSSLLDETLYQAVCE